MRVKHDEAKSTRGLIGSNRGRSYVGMFECIDPFGYLWEISQPISEYRPMRLWHRFRTAGTDLTVDLQRGSLLMSSTSIGSPPTNECSDPAIGRTVAVGRCFW
jgi:hypothetical protein